jgi:hypothetical protein
MYSCVKNCSLSLRYNNHSINFLNTDVELFIKENNLFNTINSNINLTSKQIRKRGKKDDCRLKLYQRKFKPPLPSILLSNARSIRNKTEEL